MLPTIDVNARDDDGRSPLLVAAIKCYRNTVEFLVSLSEIHLPYDAINVASPLRSIDRSDHHNIATEILAYARTMYH